MMKSFDQVKNELAAEWQSRAKKFSPNELDAEAYRRFHLERIIGEVAEYEKEGKDYKIVFVASPGNDWCGNCWQRNSKSVSLKELTSDGRYHVCSCTIVVPED